MGTTLQPPTTTNLNGVSAISGREFCIVGPKDTIFYTTDRGVSRGRRQEAMRVANVLRTYLSTN